MRLRRRASLVAVTAAVAALVAPLVILAVLRSAFSHFGATGGGSVDYFAVPAPLSGNDPDSTPSGAGIVGTAAALAAAALFALGLAPPPPHIAATLPPPPPVPNLHHSPSRPRAAIALHRASTPPLHLAEVVGASGAGQSGALRVHWHHEDASAAVRRPGFRAACSADLRGDAAAGESELGGWWQTACAAAPAAASWVAERDAMLDGLVPAAGASIRVVAGTQGPDRWIPAGGTRVRCYVADEQLPETHCEARDFALQLDRLPKPSDGGVGLDQHPDAPGLVVGSCLLDRAFWVDRNFGHGAAHWLRAGFASSLHSPGNTTDAAPDNNGRVRCDAWVDTTVYFLMRHDTTNVYHSFQDQLNSFKAYGLFDLDADAVQVVLLDSRSPDGIFADAVWGRLFSGSGRVRDVRELAREALARLPPEVAALDGGPAVCFRRAAFAVHGGVSALSRGARQLTRCPHSPLLAGFADFTRQRLRAEAAVAPALPGTDVTGAGAPTDEDDDGDEDTGGVLRVLYAERGRWSREDVAAGRCLRCIANEPAVVARVAAAMHDVTKAFRGRVGRCHSGVRFTAVDFAELSYVRQAAEAAAADVMVGVHGAGLAHGLVGRRAPRGGMVELRTPLRGRGNFQFRNMVVALGGVYEDVVLDLDDRGKVLEKDLGIVAEAVTRVVRRLCEEAYE
ncbi:hypothetical protein HK405_008574 [Cladochytrium tenue]|nr:hypothetical protein HK405_008574 [Cladochytrium tenue]